MDGENSNRRRGFAWQRVAANPMGRRLYEDPFNFREATLGEGAPDSVLSNETFAPQCDGYRRDGTRPIISAEQHGIPTVPASNPADAPVFSSRQGSAAVAASSHGYTAVAASPQSDTASPTLPWKENREIQRAVNYGGNRTVAQQFKMWDIPDNMNTALWITGLPSDCKHQDLLAQIRGIGKVYSLHINKPIYGPDPTRPLKPNSAASLAFFTTEAAQVFFQRCKLAPFRVKGRRAFVRPNQNKVAPYHDYGVSRVLIIQGLREYVTVKWLTCYLKEVVGMFWDTDRTFLQEIGAENRLEWHFGSWKSQAEAVHRAIYNNFGEWMTVSYGIDPCE
ncbi:hypothetical protein DL766_007474 [Monosporascus sp. MC13-8B]|uniref:RRM domain-containing protein n=1 Tax=Monosporascus cannonballus TaxID=155416 RepID=A0ABY0HNH7_9PEZI|nr:hypothetical protein DL763_010676 [Monosporascus cannonballus]RYO94890.1 hypothetical protein DL762_000324 [Monosporascus cannonballus]RYP23640.1 hypothetical protein DL766_007474 [Monosporascus sp. MC13-8B]